MKLPHYGKSTFKIKKIHQHAAKEFKMKQNLFTTNSVDHLAKGYDHKRAVSNMFSTHSNITIYSIMNTMSCNKCRLN